MIHTGDRYCSCFNAAVPCELCTLRARCEALEGLYTASLEICKNRKAQRDEAREEVKRLREAFVEIRERVERSPSLANSHPHLGGYISRSAVLAILDEYREGGE